VRGSIEHSLNKTRCGFGPSTVGCSVWTRYGPGFSEYSKWDIVVICPALSEVIHATCPSKNNEIGVIIVLNPFFNGVLKPSVIIEF
jgi:hypothetical protein